MGVTHDGTRWAVTIPFGKHGPTSVRKMIILMKVGSCWGPDCLSGMYSEGVPDHRGASLWHVDTADYERVMRGFGWCVSLVRRL